MALNRKLIEKWVNRLESGKYNQATGALYDDYSCEYDDETGNLKKIGEGYCCLGVLGCIMTKRSGPTFSRGLRGNGELPVYLWEKTGMRTSQDRFIQMNDEEKLSFKEIAAWIRKNILGNRNPNRRKK